MTETCLACGRTYADAYAYDDHACVDPTTVAYAALSHECHEEVTRRGITEPCDRQSVAVRIDPNENAAYPVCRTHSRPPLIPLPAVAEAIMTQDSRAAHAAR